MRLVRGLLGAILLLGSHGCGSSPSSDALSQYSAEDGGHARFCAPLGVDGTATMTIFSIQNQDENPVEVQRITPSDGRVNVDAWFLESYDWDGRRIGAPAIEVPSNIETMRTIEGNQAAVLAINFGAPDLDEQVDFHVELEFIDGDGRSGRTTIGDFGLVPYATSCA